jgi:hypothetical protein
MITAAALYAAAGLSPARITSRGEDVPSSASGVYVITVENMDAIRFLAPLRKGNGSAGMMMSRSSPSAVPSNWDGGCASSGATAVRRLMPEAKRSCSWTALS